MNRNPQTEQQNPHQASTNHSSPPQFKFPGGRDQPQKSAFRPWSKESQLEQDPKDFDSQTKKDKSSTSTDIIASPLENYIFENLKNYLQPKIEVNRIVYSELNLANAVMVDLISSDSDKFAQLQKPKKEPFCPDFKKILKDRSSLPLKERKCCKCRKSHCLLLYCDCFRAGQICEGCNCQSCMNTLEYNSERIEAVQRCLDANPLAFSTEQEGKIAKGCKCRKSGCKKGYCQCFQQGKDCTSSCICTNCQNHSHHEKNHENKGTPAKKLTVEALAV